MQLLKALWALAGAAICCFLIFVIHSQFLKEGQLAAGTCEIVTLDRDSSQPRRTIARQTARCACKKGQIAGTTRARPACVDEKKKEQHWLSGECLVNFHTGNKYRRELPRCSFLSCKELFHDHNCLGKVFQPGRTRETAIFLFAQGHLLLALESTKVVSSNPSCSIRLDLFQSLMPEDVDKLLGAMQPTTCSLYPCLTWLLLSNREIFGGGLANIINSLLWEGRMPPCLKEAMIRPILKKPFLDSSVIVSYRPVSHGWAR
ncbi:chemokine-like protein TAFA-5 isoform X2 [Hemicordylus capensis]|nr:chemokine-like protein TAFA-5 isoform X2 [Hemicordylus capensis]